MNEKRVSVFLNEAVKHEIVSVVVSKDLFETIGTMLEELSGEDVCFSQQFSIDEPKVTMSCYEFGDFRFRICLDVEVLSNP